MKRVILSCAFTLMWSIVGSFSVRADFVVLTPPNPSEYGFATPVFERGDSITALSTFSISSLGIEAVPSQSPLLFQANIYAANGLTRGPLLASASRSLTYAGQTFYDVPISFTFTGGLDYDIEIAWPTGGWNLTARFFRFDPLVFGSVPFDVGPVRVRDGNQGLNSDNWLLPNLRMQVVPEPSSLALLAVGVSSALVGWRCGRDRAPAIPR
jgi:hypothetical protein